MYREPLCPHEALPRMERVHPASTGVTRSSSLLRAHASSQHPPLVLGFALYERSSQVAASPCCMLAFPDVISAVCLWAPGPVPRRDLPVRLLVSSRSTSASRYGICVRLAIHPCKAASPRGAIPRLQSFANVQAPIVARPPGCSHRCGSKAIRAAGPFTPRNEHVVTDMNCGIATRLNRATGAAGLSPARLRPCRPLQCHPAPPAQVSMAASSISNHFTSPRPPSHAAVRSSHG